MHGRYFPKDISWKTCIGNGSSTMSMGKHVKENSQENKHAKKVSKNLLKKL
jgi:hypothetical protein